MKTYYSRAISALWFTRQTQRNNPHRGVIWQTFPDDDPQLEEQVVTASIPLDFAGYWRGVLAMDFSVSEIKAFLISAMQGGQEGNISFTTAILACWPLLRRECPDAAVAARTGTAQPRVCP